MKNKGGRPAKLTQSIRDGLISGIRQGLTLKAASRCAGISYSTLASWMNKGIEAVRREEPNQFSQLTSEIEIELGRLQKANREKELAELNQRDFHFWHDPFKSQSRLDQRRAYLKAKARGFVLCYCGRGIKE